MMKRSFFLWVLLAFVLNSSSLYSEDIGSSQTTSAPSGAAGGDLSGTYPNPTVAKANGNSVPSGAAAHQALIGTAANTFSLKTIPDCTDASGNHLNYTQSTDAFSCGTTAIPVIASVTTQYFTTSANPTYTPNAKLLYAIVECEGQGGGGGGAAASATGVSSGGGGGAGGYSRVRLTAAQIGVSQAVTNTAATNGGVTGNNAGTAGNDTSLGALCVGKGGSAGGGAAANSDGTAGAGGVAGTGDFAIVGNPGSRGEGASITTAAAASGLGGQGPWGGGAVGVQGSASAVNGSAGGPCGNGGSGGQSAGSASTAAGGQGGNGCILITEYNSQ